jgi:hypothetical protein
MRIQRVKIENHQLNRIAKHIESSIPINYSKKTDKLVVLFTEKWVLRIDGSQVNMVVINQLNEDVFIDIVSGGGGTSFFNISLFSESGSIKKVLNIVKSYCQNNSLKMIDLGLEKQVAADEGV